VFNQDNHCVYYERILSGPNEVRGGVMENNVGDCRGDDADRRVSDDALGDWVTLDSTYVDSCEDTRLHLFYRAIKIQGPLVRPIVCLVVARSR